MSEVQVVIASENPVKIRAVSGAFQACFPEASLCFEGVSVASGVSDQPQDDAETRRGALNRTLNASRTGLADYYVGVEGGIEWQADDMACFAWVVVKSNTKIGQGRTATFYLPKRVATLVKQGKELGEADDIVFGQQNSKQKMGAIGLLTDGLIDRQGLYQPAVVAALIPFLNPELY